MFERRVVFPLLVIVVVAQGFLMATMATQQTGGEFLASATHAWQSALSMFGN